MISTVLLYAALSVFILWVICKCTKRAKSYNDPPLYSGSLPIIGSTHLLWSKTNNLWNTIKVLTEDTSKQGGVIMGKIGWLTYYSISDPEDALTVANVCLEKHYFYKLMDPLFGQALLTASVPIWTRHRKLLNPAFRLPVIHGFMEIFNQQAKELADDMYACADKGPFEAARYIRNNVLRTSCLTAFGGSNHCNEETLQKYLNALYESSFIIIKRFITFWQYSNLLFNLWGPKKKLDKSIKTITTISNEIIQKVQTATTNQQCASGKFDDHQSGVTSFLDLYLQIFAKNALTINELREELDTTIAAAFGTTSIQLEIILILLGSFPKIQEKMANEIINVIGPDKNVDKEDLQKLVYTDAVIKECLRFLPATPVVARSVDQDLKLKNCTLRSGGHVVLLLYALNRDSSWGPDADQFRPERWLEPGGVPNVASAFAAFGVGKRGCIGKTYALTTLKVTLTHFVRRYQIEADYTKLQFQFEIVLKFLEGHHITLKPRNIS